jgi:bleomycin hydrolase
MSSGIYCQDSNNSQLTGSWMGRVYFENDISLRVILRFQLNNDRIRGYIDSPDQNIKDLPIKRVWMVEDSVYADASNIGAGIIFRGLILPGDSVIDGIWNGSKPLRLSETDYVFKLKINYSPEIEGYKIIKLIESTPVKDQGHTGTCWSFATTSFIETEAIRLGKNPIILSPMFYVIPTYIDKAEKYIRMDGSSHFGEGDLTFSILNNYKKYGAIPESVYSGNIDTTSKHDHFEMNSALLEKVKHYVQTGNGTMTADGYRQDIEAIMCNAMGKTPDTFNYNEKKFTPQSFANEMIGINPDDYIEITSYTHHPFNTRFILEIPANWNNNYYLNLSINDLVETIDHALMNNYSVCWDGDTRQGFIDGFAVLNDSITGITQQMRQNAFDNKTTRDVHNMHIIGIAKNNMGKRFYIVKNSDGGYVYMSREFLLLKTISVMVNKAAIPVDILQKINLQPLHLTRY